MKSEGGPPRITAGELRGRAVHVHQAGGVRPMLARTRQALFNVLGNELEGIVWDCFGGSGLLAFEALSRGAAHAVVIERDPRHADVIRQNIDAFRLEGRCTLLRSSAFSVVRPGQTLAHAPAALVFLDPPHAMARNTSGEFWPWLRGLPSTVLVNAGTTIVFGHPAGLEMPDISPLVVRDRRAYGTVAFTLLSL